MKNVLFMLTAAAMLSGCSGLHVNWVATASYNTPAVTQSVMMPGVETTEATKEGALKDNESQAQDKPTPNTYRYEYTPAREDSIQIGL